MTMASRSGAGLAFCDGSLSRLGAITKLLSVFAVWQTARGVPGPRQWVAIRARASRTRLCLRTSPFFIGGIPRGPYLLEGLRARRCAVIVAVVPHQVVFLNEMICAQLGY